MTKFEKWLEKEGWEVECDSPFEAHHEESCSSVRGILGKRLLETMFEQEDLLQWKQDSSDLLSLHERDIISQVALMEGLRKLLAGIEEG